MAGAWLPLLCRALHGRLAVAVRLDLHAARLALLRLGDSHLEHAAVELGADRVGVDALRQRQRAGEAPERALYAVPAALAGRVLGLALAGDLQRAVLHLDRHVGLGKPGKV